MPSLSIPAQRRSLRRVSRPVSSASIFGARKSEDSLSRRRAREPCEHEMHDVLGEIVLAIGDEDFLPERRQEPSAWGSALARTSARSEPACGSVRFIVAHHSPEPFLRESAA